MHINNYEDKRNYKTYIENPVEIAIIVLNCWHLIFESYLKRVCAGNNMYLFKYIGPFVMSGVLAGFSNFGAVSHLIHSRRSLKLTEFFSKFFLNYIEMYLRWLAIRYVYVPH